MAGSLYGHRAAHQASAFPFREWVLGRANPISGSLCFRALTNTAAAPREARPPRIETRDDRQMLQATPSPALCPSAFLLPFCPSARVPPAHLPLYRISLADFRRKWPSLACSTVGSVVCWPFVLCASRTDRLTICLSVRLPVVSMLVWSGQRRKIESALGETHCRLLSQCAPPHELR